MKTLVPLTPHLQIAPQTRQSAGRSLVRIYSVYHDAKLRLFLALLSPWQNGYIHFQALPPVFASYVRLRLRPLKYLRLRQVKPNGVNEIGRASCRERWKIG